MVVRTGGMADNFEPGTFLTLQLGMGGCAGSCVSLSDVEGWAKGLEGLLEALLVCEGGADGGFARGRQLVFGAIGQILEKPTDYRRDRGIVLGGPLAGVVVGFPTDRHGDIAPMFGHGGLSWDLGLRDLSGDEFGDQTNEGPR